MASESADVYAPPSWGADGRNVFGVYVDVIKGGVVVETLSQLPLTATRSFVLAGRMTPACDLVLQHPSISRVHAALQFDAHGALFLRDLNSTHGTFVNKRRVPPNEYVRLHIGDVVVFGESTRLYAVCGPPELLPEEYDSENLQQLRAKLAARRDRRDAEKRRPRDDEDGVSWGFREDAEDEDDDDDDGDDARGDAQRSATSASRRRDDNLPEYLRGVKERDRNGYESSVRAADVSAKDQRLFEQLQNKIRKMENLELEKSRILAKQNNLQGLTDGQEKTLERNAARIESLMREIHDLEDQIQAKNAQRATTRAAQASSRGANEQQRQKSQSRYDYDSDEDDFYDRTKANEQRRKQQQTMRGGGSAKTTTMSTVLTAESIQAKIKEIQDELTRVRREEMLADAKADDGAATATANGDGGEEMDSLESFMQATTKGLQQSEVDRHRKQRQELEAELKQQEKLLAIAMPALASVPPTTSSSIPATQEPSKAAPVKPSEPAQQAPLKEVSAPTSTPAPGSAPALVTATPILASKAAPAIVDREDEAKTTTDPTPAHTRKCAHVAPQSEGDTRKRRRVLGPTLPPPQPKADANILEGGDRVWVPPANQRGDGRTALNDKYGY
ncbi:hypothetical protein P43SY_008170 [Pythium insidiosum]|uniref:FHA domain-containing protein n=1 Tax=Pythium insidiosum TaxID=114742 RepID=A0AAD5LZ38_PYTIN|nr:hypothetical protein P43SY_008170 [Pythium insidiosum]